MKVGDLVKPRFGIPTGFSDVGEITRINGYYIYVLLSNSDTKEAFESEYYECELDTVEPTKTRTAWHGN